MNDNDEPYWERLSREARKCYEQERISEYKWRHTFQGEFESSMLSLDAPGVSEVLRGQCSLGEVIVDPDRAAKVAIDKTNNKSKLDHACQKLERKGKGHLVRVLRLIAKNINDKEKSICELAMDFMKTQDASTTATAKRSAKYGKLSGMKNRRKCTQPKKS